MKLPKRYLILFSVLFNLSMILFHGCNSKENAEFKNASYFIDTTKHPQQIKDNTIASDTLSGQFKKPISTTGNSEANNSSKTTIAPKRYYLIVGSFKDNKNAKRFSSNLPQTEIPTEILNFENQLNRVAKNRFTDKKQAMFELLKYRREHQDSTAWILTK